MKKFVFGKWERISKREAQKRFDLGEEIVFCPVKMHPVESWSNSLLLSRENTEGAFEQVVNACMYYGCNNETGKYLAYYKKND